MTAPKIPQSDLNLAVIGNCTYTALIDARGSIVWSCLPRFDGEPVFCRLLGGDAGDPFDGAFTIELHGLVTAEQRYRGHTAIVETRLTDANGAVLEIVDFAPRFERLERVFRPTTILRLIRPIKGTPKIAIRLRPRFNHGAEKPEMTRGSNHLRYLIPDNVLRLTTDAPITYVVDETFFLLHRPLTLMLGPDEPIIESLPGVATRFLDATARYWHQWSRALAIPFEWQQAVIRAAITLKLCSFEETGAIVAAVTTSIPEFAHSGRNWDYRFCWFRDAYFVVQILIRLGKTRAMEGYLRFILNVVSQEDEAADLQPVYGIGTESRLEESIVTSLPGYRDMGPVRTGNAAYYQIQNDSYGAVILGCAHVFFDERLGRTGDVGLFERLERLGVKAVACFDVPDAGLWELRNRTSVHTYSAVMCWAAADRLARIARRLSLSNGTMAGRAAYWRTQADRMKRVIEARAWNDRLGCFAATFEGDEADASLLLLAELGFLKPGDPRFAATVDFVGRTLKRGDLLLRYAVADDFGLPETAFTICTFWYVTALASIGRRDEARELFERLLSYRNPMGLLSEDIDQRTGELWGNFPQTYSLVGLIHSALRLSEPWDDAL